MAIRRAFTLQNIVEKKVSKFPFAGAWFDAFGTPQKTGIWFICGESGSGKTTFVLDLIKCLAMYSNSVLLESYEEGKVSAALQDAILRLGMTAVKNVIVADDTHEEMIERLEGHKSANVVIIDSVEHSEFRDIKQVVDLKRQFPNKLFIFIGQASGTKPRTMLGESILFIANQKIWIEGYRAFSRGRSNGPLRYYTIWEQEANIYWDK